MGASEADHVPLFAALTTYFSYTLLIVVGHIRDWVLRQNSKAKDGQEKGKAPLVKDWENFYARNLYRRIEDCFCRPISSAPGAWIDVCERERDNIHADFRLTGESRRCLNLGSYNYLGFAAEDEYCTPRVISTMHETGWTTCSSRLDGGTTEVHEDLEQMVAKFLRKPAALSWGMGFATNTTVLPSLVNKGCLVVSDQLNHKSIVDGVKLSGAKVKVFVHNDMKSLEKILRTSIVQGQPRTGRPWKKILIVIEGIYSMEGDMPLLKEIVALKKKYNCYLYLDEAHSIGALGQSGRGLCEHTGVSFDDVDVLMGTFTKSFGSCGGYIASTKDVIEYLRNSSPGFTYATSISMPAAQQILSSLEVVAGKDGTTRGQEKIQKLKDNANFLRKKLKAAGCAVLGSEDSPVIPMMIFHPAKISALTRECYKYGLAIVVVGFPATPLLLARARLCISAAHSREDLEYACDILIDATMKCSMAYNL
ncbi:pyridoxal phosphate-dependent transferase [Chloropicon primus]|nr:pyridoxal phosphate-dependent transferase [Chloropicon primus]